MASIEKFGIKADNPTYNKLVKSKKDEIGNNYKQVSNNYYTLV